MKNVQKKTLSTSLVAAAVTGMLMAGSLTSCSSSEGSMKAEMNGCSGKNGCKGQNGCDGKNSCQGKNDCSGKSSCEGKK